MFISIVFGVFIAVWIEPVTDIFPYTKEFFNFARASSQSGDFTTAQLTLTRLFEETRDHILTKEMFIGFIMFVMLVCLWWWYGMFLGNLSPAKGFWLYFYDFVTLCSFAIAFRLWYHPIIFPIIVLIAAGLMLGRFGGVIALVDEVKAETRARSAIWLAMFVLLAFVFFGIGMFALPYFTRGEYFEKLIADWAIYQGVINGLLVVGIIATWLAVLITEGRPFTFPREPEDWKRERSKKAGGTESVSYAGKG